MTKKLFAEFFGTFGLVLIGTGAIVIQEECGNITHLGISLSFMLGVFAMILLFANISGAHLNPAVTIAFTVAKQLPFKMMLLYMVSQLLGAVCGSGLLHFLFPHSELLGTTLPKISVTFCFLIEAMMTFILMLAILLVSNSKWNSVRSVAFIASFTVFLEAYFAGPFTGASMNPARSFGPAWVSGHMENFWIYALAPVIGAVAAISLWSTLRPKLLR